MRRIDRSEQAAFFLAGEVSVIIPWAPWACSETRFGELCSAVRSKPTCSGRLRQSCHKRLYLLNKHCSEPTPEPKLVQPLVRLQRIDRQKIGCLILSNSEFLMACWFSASSAITCGGGLVSSPGFHTMKTLQVDVRT